MNRFHESFPYLVGPTGLGFAGGIAVIAAGGWRWFGALVATVLGAAGLVVGRHMAAGEHRDVGVIVDAMNEVLEIAATDIEPPPAFGAKICTDFIAGIGKVNGKFVILLNVDHVLSTDRIGALAAVDACAQADTVAAGEV